MEVDGDANGDGSVIARHIEVVRVGHQNGQEVWEEAVSDWHPGNPKLERGEGPEATLTEAQGPLVLAGCFELHEVAGSGGMAVVYRAWDRARRRPCAVKVLGDLLSRDEKFRLRFRQEAEAARGLTHPHIVRVYDWGESGPHHYIVMEYVDGGTLRDLLSQRGGLSETTAIQFASDVADALAYAHARGVIHRDIKPQNILLAKDGTAMVADFGIARTIDASGLTRTGIVMGSAHYLSPEQARGDPAGPRSDLYALGVVFFEMLAGRVPFDGDSAVAIALKHLHEPPPDLRRVRPDLSPATAAIVERLLAKAPEDRPLSAAALAADLRRAAEGIPGGRGDETAAISGPVLRQEAETTPDVSGYPTQALPEVAPPTTQLSAGAVLAAAKAPGATSVLPATRVADTAQMPGAPQDTRSRTRVRQAQPAPAPLGWPPAWAISSVLGLCVAALLIVGSFGSWVTAHVATPSLVGRTVADAGRVLRPLQIGAVVASQRQDPRVASGVIIGQDPPPGRWLLKGSVVRLAVSQGSGIVPDLRGLRVPQATRRLDAAGLRLGPVRYIHDDAISNGAVILQFQPLGTHLAPDAPVEVLVSLGPPALFPGIPWPFPGPKPQPEDGGNK